jgi:VanZ family protein
VGTDCYRPGVVRVRAASRWLPWIAALGWAGVIFYFSSLQHASLSDAPMWDWVTRKMAHLFVFAVLAFLMGSAASAFRLPRPALIGFLIAAVYGALDELHQGFVVGRSPLVTDVLIDAIGALIGVTAWWYLDRRRRGAERRID